MEAVAKKNDPPEIVLSRSAIEEFIRCPRCFYLHRRRGLKPPSMIPLTLAVATDALLKNEFDAIRASGADHPIWRRENLNVEAYSNPHIEEWRNNRKGIRIKHAQTGATIFGAVDDIWRNKESEDLHVVDYKSTSKKDVPSLEGGFGDSYKRQMDIYQWLLDRAGYPVNQIGFFLYVNGVKDGGFFDGTTGRMFFTTTLIPYRGDTSWVDETVSNAVSCFQSDQIPRTQGECDTCRYVTDRSVVTADPT